VAIAALLIFGCKKDSVENDASVVEPNIHQGNSNNDGNTSVSTRSDESSYSRTLSLKEFLEIPSVNSKLEDLSALSKEDLKLNWQNMSIGEYFIIPSKIRVITMEDSTRHVSFQLYSPNSTNLEVNILTVILADEYSYGYIIQSEDYASLRYNIDGIGNPNNTANTTVEDRNPELCEAEGVLYFTCSCVGHLIDDFCTCAGPPTYGTAPSVEYFTIYYDCDIDTGGGSSGENNSEVNIYPLMDTGFEGLPSGGGGGSPTIHTVIDESNNNDVENMCQLAIQWFYGFNAQNLSYTESEVANLLQNECGCNTLTPDNFNFPAFAACANDELGNNGTPSNQGSSGDVRLKANKFVNAQGMDMTGQELLDILDGVCDGLPTGEFSSCASQNLLGVSSSLAELAVSQGLVGSLQIFLVDKGYSEDSQDYVETFLELKKEDSAYKWARFEELYELVEMNPDFLIQECGDVTPWADLASFEIPQSCEDRLEDLGSGWENQDILDGNSPTVNLDRHSVTIQSLPDFNGDGVGTSQEFFDEIRENFPEYANGSTTVEINNFPDYSVDWTWSFFGTDITYGKIKTLLPQLLTLM